MLSSIKYESFDGWVKDFITTLLKYPRLVINMPYDLCARLGLVGYIDTWLVNGKTHFNKNKKREVLIKLNFQ